ncbi:MAG: ROK family protein [Cyclobacteriaceae bacterium]|nr:ROK family protein [Cyclobacteriaceae bacterium]
MDNLWGIDLGGTKIEGAVLKSAGNPEVLFRDRLPTEGHKGYEHILGQIKKVVEKMESTLGYKPSKIGIATPGTLDPGLGLMKNSNSTNLNGKPLKRDLESLLGVEMFMANDANCFALAEANMGAAKENFPKAKVVFGVILGTGVGGGVVVNGKVINGLQGIGGEWGHNFLDESGGACYCGKSGCVEKILAGPALEKYYASISGQSKNMKEVYELYKGGDPYATQTMERLIHFFGLALSVVVNILDPDVIVIGGGVGNIDSIYSAGRESLKKYVFNNKLDTAVIKPKLGDSAGVFGAAFLGN